MISAHLRMTVLALGAALGLLAVYHLTLAPIEANREAWARRLLLEAAAAESAEEISLLASGKHWQVHQSGQLVAQVLYQAGEPGYNGRIPLWVGIDTQGRIIRVRVIEHRETPGLGDRISHLVSPWIEQFQGHSLGNPGLAGWALKQDGGNFEGFTGATITPRAVVAGVRKTLQEHARQDSGVTNP